jgi:SEC-C motif
MVALPASDHRIRRAAVDALGRRCVTAAMLAVELERSGTDLGQDGSDRLADVLDMSSEFVELDDGWAGVAAHLDGTRWITAVSADDAKSGVLRLDPDLALLGWWSLDAGLTLGETGDLLETGELLDSEDVLIGPAGWLVRYAGAHVEVRIGGTALHLAPASREPDVPAEVTAALLSTFEQRARLEELRDALGSEPFDLTQMSVEDLLWESLVGYPEVFSTHPIPPLEVNLRAAGLIRDDQTVLRGAADRGALHRWRQRNRLASQHRLDGEQVDWAELAIAMSKVAIARGVTALGSPEEVAAAAMLLAHTLDDTAVCRAVLGFHVDEETPPPALAEFARLVIAELPAGRGAGARWLEGRALDLDGDPEGATVAFEAAVATGEEHPLALIGLAGFRADAGDAVAAVSLLRRAGIDADADPDDPAESEAVDLFAEVDGYARHRPPALAGRNDPCPCGSGRKYKACHLGNERPSLIDRGPWLYAKARRYIRDHDRSLIAALAGDMSAASGRGHQFLIDLLDSELVADIALCEARLGDRFVAERDAVLPDDEALLAQRWQLVERSLFEVEKAGGTHLALRDLRTGDRITVTNTNADSQTQRGELMLGRPLPVNDTWRAYSGFVKVGGLLRDEILDALDHPDPFQIAELIGRCLAPPRMSNTDGEPLQFHELVWKLADPKAARRALDADPALLEDDGVYRLVRDTVNQRQTVVLTLTIDGDELRADANSDRRADEVTDLVSRLIPDSELVHHDLRDVDEALEAHRASGEPPAANRLDDPEMANVRDEITAELERRWLDDHIPALGGRTPREAALDPTGRHELEGLLDTFGDSPGLMSATRIRQALDL